LQHDCDIGVLRDGVLPIGEGKLDIRPAISNQTGKQKQQQRNSQRFHIHIFSSKLGFLQGFLWRRHRFQNPSGQVAFGDSIICVSPPVCR
jgi:hypothetical protein